MEPGGLPALQSSRRVAIVFNPAAGPRRRSARLLAAVVAELEKLGCATVVRATSPAAGDAERLARDSAADCDVVVAAGGDGTVNGVANGIAGSGRAMAILPLGTANLLAAEIAAPREPERLAAMIARGQPRPIWPGRVGARLFLAMAGSGFDAEVVEAVDAGLKRRIGKLAFAVAIAACIRRNRGCELSLRADGAEHRAASAIVAKSRYYGGRFVIAPAARILNPTLHLVLFRSSGRLAALRYLMALGLGRLHRLPDVAVFPVRQVSIAAAAACSLHADGEIVTRLPVSITLAAEPILLLEPHRS